MDVIWSKEDKTGNFIAKDDGKIKHEVTVPKNHYIVKDGKYENEDIIAIYPPIYFKHSWYKFCNYKDRFNNELTFPFVLVCREYDDKVKNPEKETTFSYTVPNKEIAVKIPHGYHLNNNGYCMVGDKFWNHDSGEWVEVDSFIIKNPNSYAKYFKCIISRDYCQG